MSIIKMECILPIGRKFEVDYNSAKNMFFRSKVLSFNKAKGLFYGIVV